MTPIETEIIALKKELGNMWMLVQSQLNKAVSQATGEDFELIDHRGFSLVDENSPLEDGDLETSRAHRTDQRTFARHVRQHRRQRRRPERVRRDEDDPSESALSHARSERLGEPER